MNLQPSANAVPPSAGSESSGVRLGLPTRPDLTTDRAFSPQGGRSGSLAAGADGFYRVRDARGHEHIVDSIDKLPEALRGRAERVELASPSPILSDRSPWLAQPSSGPVHWPSFGLGAGTIVLVGLVLWMVLRKGGSRVVRLVSVFTVVAVTVGLYFGWLRRTAGQAGGRGSWVASPSSVIDDARRTVDKANESAQQRDRMLRELEQEGKRLETAPRR